MYNPVFIILVKSVRIILHFFSVSLCRSLTSRTDYTPSQFFTKYCKTIIIFNYLLLR